MRAKSNVNISRQLCSDWLKMWYSPWIFFCNPTPKCDEILSLFSYIMGSNYRFYKKEQSLLPLVERAIWTITSSIISFIIRYIVWLRSRLLHDFPLIKVSSEYVYLHSNISFEKKIGLIHFYKRCVWVPKNLLCSKII